MAKWYSNYWFNCHMLESSTHFQNATQQLDLSPVATEPTHVDRLEVIEVAHRVGNCISASPCQQLPSIILYICFSKTNL